MSRALVDFLKSVVPAENVREEEPMSGHTTFRVGGPAEVFVTVENQEQLGKVLHYLDVTGWPYFLLGNGSNLLVGDRGYRGVVIRLSGEFAKVSAEGCRIMAGAAAMLSVVAKTAMENGLSGLEFASGIPGSVGGGVRMNAGAYGGEMCQTVESVQVMYRDGSVLVLDRDTMEFGYRSSVLKDRPYAVTEVCMKLQQGDREEILQRMNDFAARRREKQPLEYASAGSTFKRPEGHFAGKMIMEAGLAGSSRGGARVSEKHCGFIINDGTATAADIAELIRHVTAVVQERTGVRLEPEVIFLGDF